MTTDISAETHALIKEAARAAAHEAVIEVLEKIGIEPDEHKEVQKDMIWMRKWRMMSERLGSRVLMTVATILSAGVIGLVWQHITGTK